MIVIGVFAVRGVQGSTAGASSPDDFVKQLSAATTNVDPAAALALIDPKEVPELGAFFETAVDQAAKGADVDVPKVLRALTLTVSGVEFHIEYLDSDHEFAKVVFEAGRVGYETHPDELPPEVKERLGDDDGGADPSLTEPQSDSGDVDDLRIITEDGTTIDPFLVLVKEDGRWYVSITMTAGQYAVELAGLPTGNFDDPEVPGPPASSPADAVVKLLDAGEDAVNDGHYDGAPLIGLFPEAETRAFRIYGDSIDGAIDRTDEGWEADGEGGFTGLADECSGCGVEYSNLKVSTQHNGSLTYAVIDALDIEATTRTGCYALDDFGYEGEYGDDYDFGEDFGFDDGFDDAYRSPSDDPEVTPSAHRNRSLDSDDCGTVTEAIRWDGSCVSLQETYSDGAGAPDDTRACLRDELGDSGLNLTDFGITSVHVVVSQERGGWVIDPVATVLDYGRTTLSHLSDPKVKQAIDD